ncbi:UNVERIFIED_CONTAM: hypothetical protein Sradi_5628900 [Sesamum radiatum]|uniref:Reverse transcriptase/retrotransposon-derived protein RNase H-like domain-containing protein n=1 Tax=Sesamum radiatum TaxID=300843 RepID=A0AAW2L2V8_SESRA
MKALTCVNEVQRLRRIAALSRFISKSVEKSLPFFKTLRKTKTFQWDASCQHAFEKLKDYLAWPPLLVKTSRGDTLYLYLSATLQAVSSILLREKEGKQLPIYYISKVPNGAEGRYAPIEKMALALVTTAKRLRPYFLAHPIGGSGAGIVITSPQGEDLEFTVKFGFKASSNEAEYEALVIDMRMAYEVGVRHLLAY